MKTKWRALVLVGALFLGGCATMPTSGDPQAFEVAAPNTEPVEQLGFGPVRNSTPERIISDFLRASAAGSTDDYLTAKKYLKDDLASSWNPRAGVLIYPTEQTPGLRLEMTGTGTATVYLETEVTATLDEEGVLSPGQATTVELSFDLVRSVDDQWRISRMDDGVILSKANFQAVYQAQQLYFLAPDQESLVPDPRWFPRRRLASHLVTGLLAGPSEQLAPAVYSALSGSLTLPTQGVEVDGQTVRVNMEGEVPGDRRTQENISRQLSATLFQMTNVTEVVTQINSVLLPATPDPFSASLELDAAVALSDGAIAVSAGEGWSPVVPAELVGPDAKSPARAPIADGAIAWIQDGISVWDGTEVHHVELAAPTAPSVDRWNWTWTSSGEASGVVAINSRGESVELALPQGVSTQIRKVVVSPDGVHLLVLVDGADGLQAMNAVVVRDPLGAPQSIDQIDLVSLAGAGLVDGDWAGSTQMVFLAGHGEEREVRIVALGGFAQVLGAPSDTIRVSAGGQAGRILLETATGQYYSRSGGVWRSLEARVSAISYAG